MESSMSKAGLDNRHRNRNGEISGKHGNTLIRTLRKVYGQSFAADLSILSQARFSITSGNTSSAPQRPRVKLSRFSDNPN
jgi:hypothetical protein